MQPFRKVADSMESAASPIPQVQITPTPTPGKSGPVGMGPRQNTSQVNSGAPPVADAGATAQKTAPPIKLAQHRSEDLMTQATMAARPSVHDMIKAAMAGTAEKISLSAEAEHQHKLAAEKCAKCDKAPCVCSKEAAKHASSSDTSTEQVTKLASALEWVASELEKGASISISSGTSKGTESGEGPGALKVMQAQASGRLSDNSGQATGPHIVPKSTGLQAQDGSTTLIPNNLASPPGGGGKQQNAMVSQKGKTASAPLSTIRKLAEDALNPAHISAGPTVKPDTREAGQAGGVPPAGSQAGMVGSVQSAIGYTKGQAKAEPKSDLKAYLTEPALSGAHDQVLQNAFSHTGQAGTKMASDNEAKHASIKTAAARALLSNLLDQTPQPKAS